MVARGGIEPPTRGFSTEEIRYRGLILNHLQSLPAPKPAYPWHIPGTPSLSSTHSWRVTLSPPVEFAQCLARPYNERIFSGTGMKCMSARIAKRKHDRLEVRLTPDAKALLEWAASVERKTISAFLLDKGLAAAAETLEDRREFRLPAKQYDAFVARTGS